MIASGGGGGGGGGWGRGDEDKSFHPLVHFQAPRSAVLLANGERENLRPGGLVNTNLSFRMLDDWATTNAAADELWVNNCENYPKCFILVYVDDSL